MSENHDRHDHSHSDALDSTVVGIDLGTTNSLIAIVQDGQPRILKTREGERLLPSVVTIQDGKLSIGYAAKKRKVRDAEHTVFSAKRLLGRGLEDIRAFEDQLPYKVEKSSDGALKIRVGEQLFSAIEISAKILTELKLSAEAALGRPVQKAVITVPAYFNDSQRQATRAAGRLAGLEVLRILNEPTAASLAYGLQSKREGIIAVFDLGGGTFDLSILRLRDGIFEVLATHGDTQLGGDDFDRAIYSRMSAEVLAKLQIDVSSDVYLRAALLEASEALKHAFSESDRVDFKVNLCGKSFVRPWTRAEFEELIEPLLARAQVSCEPA
jgi:molecular chaperone DnaK (HSP70)